MDFALCLFQSLLQSERLKLETNQLVLASCIFLLDGEQPLDKIHLGLLQVSLANALDVTVWVNARGLRGDRDLALAPLLSSTAPVGYAMFAVVSMRFRIPKNPCFLDATAFGVHFVRTGTDGFQSDCLPIGKQTINRCFYQIDRPLPPGLMILL